MSTKSIHSLHTYSIKTYTFLECLAIVLTTRIEYAHCLNQLALRDTTTIVTHTYTLVIGHLNLDTLAGMHLKLVNTVIDDFLQQHVDTIIILRTITQFTNVHTWT